MCVKNNVLKFDLNKISFKFNSMLKTRKILDIKYFLYCKKKNICYLYWYSTISKGDHYNMYNKNNSEHYEKGGRPSSDRSQRASIFFKNVYNYTQTHKITHIHIYYILLF